MSHGHTSDWLLRHQTREMLRKADRAGVCLTHPTADSGPESVLQDKIEQECRQRQWAFARTRMDKATTFTMAGVPDFIIAMHSGRTLYMEVKTKTGKQSAEQKGFQVLLEMNGHEYHLVRSFAEFLSVTKNTTP